MRIALIGTSASCVLGFRASLIRELVAQGNTVFALALDYSKEDRAKVIQLGATPIDYRFSRAGLNPISDFVNTVRLIGLIRRLSVDISFSYFAKPVVFGTLASWLAGVKKRIAMLEGLGYAFTPSRRQSSFKSRIIKFIQIALYRISFPLLDHLILLNPDDLNDLVIHYEMRIKKVDVVDGIGVDLKDFSETPVVLSPFTFLFIGRFLAEKGIREFVQAASKVKKIFPEVHFIMLGGVDLQNPGSLAQSELSELVASGVVEYPGYVKDVRPWIDRSTVFVLPSYREGLPRSTQEAMARGRAVITSDVPGCRQTVENGKNGFLVQPGSFEDLVEKMEKLIRNPELALHMGQYSRQIAMDRFDSRKINQKMLQIINE